MCPEMFIFLNSRSDLGKAKSRGIKGLQVPEKGHSVAYLKGQQ